MHIARCTLQRGGEGPELFSGLNDRDVTSYFKFRICARPPDFVASCWRAGMNLYIETKCDLRLFGEKPLN